MELKNCNSFSEAYSQFGINENISNFRFVVFDTETTGLSPVTEDVIELAAVVFDEEFEHRVFHTLINPGRKIPAAATAVHGLTDKDLIGAPDLHTAYENFYEFLSAAGGPLLLLAHNARFDLSFLKKALFRKGAPSKELPLLPVIDTCIVSRILNAELKSHSLESLMHHYSLATNQTHRALDDVRILQQVFMQLLVKFAETSSRRGAGMTLADLIDVSGAFFLIDPKQPKSWTLKPELSPKLSILHSFCDLAQNGASIAETKLGIVYAEDEEYRHISPLALRSKGYFLYLTAYCHRDEKEKVFRVDRIRRLDRV